MTHDRSRTLRKIARIRNRLLGCPRGPEESGNPDCVILDVRSPEAFAAGHVPGAINLPHGQIVERNLTAFPARVAFVVYCSAPTGTERIKRQCAVRASVEK